MKLAVGALLLVSLSSCGEPPLDSVSAEKFHYTNPTEQRQLKSALQRANIPFEVHSGSGGREEIWYESRFKDQVSQERDDVFEVPPPMGRSISLGDERNETLVEELKKRNASHWRVTYRSHEYIAWPPESDDAADASLEVVGANAHGLIEMKKMREAADAEARDQANHSSRSHAERITAER